MATWKKTTPTAWRSSAYPDICIVNLSDDHVRCYAVFQGAECKPLHDRTTLRDCKAWVASHITTPPPTAEGLIRSAIETIEMEIPPPRSGRRHSQALPGTLSEAVNQLEAALRELSKK